MTESATPEPKPDMPEPTPEQLYQHHAGGTYRLMMRQLKACAAEYPGNDEAQIAGVMMALVHHYVQQTKAPGQAVLARDVTVALTPVLFKSAEAVIDGLKALDKTVDKEG